MMAASEHSNSEIQATTITGTTTSDDHTITAELSLDDLNTMLSSATTTIADDDPELAAAEAAIEADESNVDGDGTTAGDLMASLTLALDEEETIDFKSSSRTPSAVDASTEMVPLQQFLNAMTIIQDLESRVAVLEDERTKLLEETDQQKMMISSYEQKLSAFPQMMEQLMAENDKIVAKAATESAKSTYWDQHMRKEEAKHAKEQQLRTDTLQQSDFLADIVARKAVESQQGQNSIWKRLSSVSLGSTGSVGGGSGGRGRGRGLGASGISIKIGRKSSVASSRSSDSQNGTGGVTKNQGGPTTTVSASLNGSSHFTIDDDEDDDDPAGLSSELFQNTSTDSDVLDLIS